MVGTQPVVRWAVQACFEAGERWSLKQNGYFSPKRQTKELLTRCPPHGVGEAGVKKSSRQSTA